MMNRQAYNIRTMVTGCTTTGKDLVRDDIVNIEQVSSTYATVTRTSVVQEGPDVVISGEVQRRASVWNLLSGHVNVEIVGPDGQVLKKTSVRYYPSSFDYHRLRLTSGYATFSTRIKTTPPVGSSIRVTHVWGE